jgi:hypothetical protein
LHTVDTGSSIENLALRAGEAGAIDLVTGSRAGGIATSIEEIGIAWAIRAGGIVEEEIAVGEVGEIGEGVEIELSAVGEGGVD